MTEETAGFHLSVNVPMKAPNTNFSDPVLFILYREHVKKILCKEWIEETKSSDQWLFSTVL